MEFHPTAGENDFIDNDSGRLSNSGNKRKNRPSLISKLFFSREQGIGF